MADNLVTPVIDPRTGDPLAFGGINPMTGERIGAVNPADHVEAGGGRHSSWSPYWGSHSKIGRQDVGGGRHMSDLALDWGGVT